MNYSIHLLTIVFSLITGTVNVNPVNHKVSDEFSITINGTSNVHDWVSNVEKIKGTASIIFDENNNVFIDDCNINLPVKSIISENGSIMDKKTWKAMKEREFPNITYRLTSIENQINSSNGFTAYAKGKLSIAGVERSVLMHIKGTKLSRGAVQITGSKTLKMTDYGIEPPTALMGAMTTGNEIAVDFKIKLLR